MTDDPGSLANLRDLAMPPPVPFWPPAPGVWILAAGGLACLAIIAHRAVLRHRAGLYRRDALAALAQIDPAAPGAVLAIFAVLKRASLVAFPRPDVASLTGAPFASFLAEGPGGIDRGLALRLEETAYDAAGRPAPNDVAALLAQARMWLRGHRGPEAQEEPPMEPRI